MTIKNHQLTKHACLWIPGGNPYRENMQTSHRRPTLDSNQEPSYWEATAVTNLPVCHAVEKQYSKDEKLKHEIFMYLK